MMTEIVRFAPSPTGLLHVGNARTLIHNYLYTLKNSAKLILRIDDTDEERSRREFEDAILADIDWLGIESAALFRQSERFERYHEAVERLKKNLLLYPCYETADELERKRKLQRAQGLPPVYDRAALALTDTQKAQYEGEGRRPHWRFRLSGDPVHWVDEVRGEVSIETASLSDPILVREDGTYLYTLPSCVDDVEMGITQIMRGEDHVTNSAAQIEVFRALGAEPPRFAHTSLLIGSDGNKLSKRIGSLALKDLRAQGILPLAVGSLLAKIGTSDAVEARDDWQTLANEFAFSKIGRAPARFDESELSRLNRELVRRLSFEAARETLSLHGIGGAETFWTMARENIDTIAGAAHWWAVVQGPIEPVIEDRDFCTKAAGLLPQEPLTPDSWSDFTNAVKEATGAKGKALFMPLRLALTGESHGPDMAAMFQLIGTDKAHARLLGSRA
jgi:glutamyl-tRNA synthetase